jgi:hypothetical protein
MGIKTDRRALTILELISVMLLLSFLIAALSLSYMVGIRTWHESFVRNEARDRLAQSVELMGRMLRQAQSIDAIDDSSVSFTVNMEGVSTPHRIYLYHPEDGEPNPPYSRELYWLKFAREDIEYGKGSILSSDIVASDEAIFTQAAGFISINLQRRYSSDKTVAVSTNVGLRNL